MDNNTYVHEGTEVQKTGKKAQRKTPSGKTDELVEITPFNNTGGIWKKWVRESDLYIVQPDETSTNE